MRSFIFGFLILSFSTSYASVLKDSCVMRGIQSMQIKDYQTAIQIFNKCLNNDPTNASIYFQRGTCYLLINKANIALVDLNKSLQLDTSHYESYYNRALAHQSLKNYTFAEADFLFFLMHENKTIQVFLNLAILMEEMGDYSSAIKYYTNYIEKRPDDVSARKNRALAYAEIDSLNLAIEDIDRCLKPLANDTGLWMIKGNLYYDALKYNEAIDAYNVVLLIDPLNKIAFINRADALTASNQYIEAIKDYTSLSKTDKYNPQYYFNIGFCYLQLNQNEDAILSFGKALDTEFQSLGMLLTFRGVAYHNLNMQAEACSDWKKALQAAYPEAKSYIINYCN